MYANALVRSLFYPLILIPFPLLIPPTLSSFFRLLLVYILLLKFINTPLFISLTIPIIFSFNQRFFLKTVFLFNHRSLIQLEVHI